MFSNIKTEREKKLLLCSPKSYTTPTHIIVFFFCFFDSEFIQFFFDKFMLIFIKTQFISFCLTPMIVSIWKKIVSFVRFMFLCKTSWKSHILRKQATKEYNFYGNQERRRNVTSIDHLNGLPFHLGVVNKFLYQFNGNPNGKPHTKIQSVKR